MVSSQQWGTFLTDRAAVGEFGILTYCSCVNLQAPIMRIRAVEYSTYLKPVMAAQEEVDRHVG